MTQEHCIICDEIEPRQTTILPLQEFVSTLDNLSMNTSFDSMTRTAYNYYINKCFIYNEEYSKRNEHPLPEISKEQILYHLKNHNKSHQQTLFNIFEHSAKQVNYYRDKICNIQNTIDNRGGDVIMADDGDDFEIGTLTKELDRYHDLYERNVNITLKVNASIKRNF